MQPKVALTHNSGQMWESNLVAIIALSMDLVHPLYPEHFLLNYEDEGLIVVWIEVAHLYGCLLFLSDALALAIQELKFDVRV